MVGDLTRLLLRLEVDFFRLILLNEELEIKPSPLHSKYLMVSGHTNHGCKRVCAIKLQTIFLCKSLQHIADSCVFHNSYK